MKIITKETQYPVNILDINGMLHIICHTWKGALKAPVFAQVTGV